jgi:hypothetical protein
VSSGAVEATVLRLVENPEAVGAVVGDSLGLVGSAGIVT